MRLAAAALLGAAAVGLVALSAGGGVEETQRPASTRAVSISIGSPGAGAYEVGTGFTAGPGRVVTVAHLVDGERVVAVRVPGRGASPRGRVLRVDARNDLALLAVPGLSAPPLRTGRAGEKGRVLVHRRGRAFTLHARVRREITAHLRGARARPALELGVRIAPGDSGAPVVAPGGELIGMIFARSRRREGTAYAVAAGAVARLLGEGAG